MFRALVAHYCRVPWLQKLQLRLAVGIIVHVRQNVERHLALNPKGGFQVRVYVHGG